MIWNNFEIEIENIFSQELVCRDCGTRFTFDLESGENVHHIDKPENIFQEVEIPKCPGCGVIG